MSYQGTREAIVAVLEIYAGPPSIYAENIATSKGDLGGEFARWSIRPADVTDSEVGGLRERGVGTLYFQHFVPEGGGTKPAWDFADKIGGLFNRARVGFTGGVMIFERAVCQYIGVTDGRVQHNITVAWRQDSAALNAP